MMIQQEKNKNLDMARLLVHIPFAEMLNKSFKIRINGNCFVIKVIEEFIGPVKSNMIQTPVESENTSSEEDDDEGFSSVTGFDSDGLFKEDVSVEKKESFVLGLFEKQLFGVSEKKAQSCVIKSISCEKSNKVDSDVSVVKETCHTGEEVGNRKVVQARYRRVDHSEMMGCDVSGTAKVQKVKSLSNIFSNSKKVDLINVPIVETVGPMEKNKPCINRDVAALKEVIFAYNNASQMNSNMNASGNSIEEEDSMSNKISGGFVMYGYINFDFGVVQSNKRFWKNKVFGSNMEEIWSRVRCLGMSGGESVSQQIEAIGLREVQDKRSNGLKDATKRGSQ